MKIKRKKLPYDVKVNFFLQSSMEAGTVSSHRDFGMVDPRDFSRVWTILSSPPPCLVNLEEMS